MLARISAGLIALSGSHCALLPGHLKGHCGRVTPAVQVLVLLHLPQQSHMGPAIPLPVKMLSLNVLHVLVLRRFFLPTVTEPWELMATLLPVSTTAVAVGSLGH